MRISETKSAQHCQSSKEKLPEGDFSVSGWPWAESTKAEDVDPHQIN